MMEIGWQSIRKIHAFKQFKSLVGRRPIYSATWFEESVEDRRKLWPKTLEKLQNEDIGDNLTSRSQFRDGGKLHWFPSHQRKSIKKIEEIISQVDFVIEVRDARIPLSSTNPIFDRIVANKPRLIVFNKTDITIPYDTTLLEKYLYERYNAKAIWITAQNRKSVRRIIQYALDAQFKRPELYPFVHMMIVGNPNVGKSTILNKLCIGDRKPSKIGAFAGVTTAVQMKVKIWKEPPIYLIDTPGLYDSQIADSLTALKFITTGATNNSIVNIKDAITYILFRLNNSSTKKVYPKILNLPDNKPIYNVDEFLLEIAKNKNYLLDMNRKDIKMETEMNHSLNEISDNDDFLSSILNDNDYEMISESNSNNKSNQKYDIELASKFVLREFQSGRLGRITLDDMSNENIERFFNGCRVDPYYIDTLAYKTDQFTNRGKKVKDKYI